MNNFVMSGPAADLRALERVLIISPFGSTTVCVRFVKLSGDLSENSYNIEEPFGPGSPIPNCIRCGDGQIE